MTDSLQICDVSLRDGLQSAQGRLTTAQKVDLFRRLQQAGITRFEGGSFVSKTLLPSMADSAEVIAKAIQMKNTQQILGLVFNERGVEELAAIGASWVGTVLIISEPLCKKNTGKSVAEHQQQIIRVIRRAATLGLQVRLTVAPAWVCPFVGEISKSQLLHAVRPMLELEIAELALADTIGWATPNRVTETLEVMQEHFPVENTVGHFHDTLGFALANAAAAIASGVRLFDTSIGGLGGCPFAPGARGNLATEDLVLFGERMGFKTGVDLRQLWQTITHLQTLLPDPLGGRTADAWEMHGETLTHSNSLQGERHATQRH